MMAIRHLSSISVGWVQLDAVARLSALRIVDCLVEGTLIAIFASLILKLARRQSSGTRFAVWFSALLAIAVLPLLGGVGWSYGTSPRAGSASHPVLTLPSSWALYLFVAWVVIAALAMTRVIAGVWQLHKLRRDCVPIDAALLDATLRETLERHSAARSVTVCTSERVHAPTAIGIVRPAVVLPGWVMRDLSSDEVNQILLHELAHLRRWDDWTNLTQKVVKALFFFHPAVWWIERRVSLEREMACDDAVLAETAKPRAYAECLAHLVERTLIRRSVALAQAALGRMRHMSLRVAQILDANRPAKNTLAWKPAVSLVAGFAVACVLCVSRRPRLVAFEGGAANHVTRAAAPAFERSSPTTGALFPTTGAHALPAALHNQRVPIVPAMDRKLSSTGRDRSFDAPRESNHGAVIQRPTFNLTAGSVHLTQSVVTTTPFTETVFVVVEGRGHVFSDQPAYEIHVWRLMILGPAVDPAVKGNPPKQT